MKTTLFYAGLAFAAGLAVAMAIPRSETRPPMAGTTSTPDTLQQVSPQALTVGDNSAFEDFERRLEDEIRARERLERRLEALQRQLADLETRRAAGFADEPGSNTEAAAAQAADGAPAAWFDEQALIASGMDSALAGELRHFFEGLELERLQLRDLAEREGWDRARRREGLEALDSRELQLRERLGESGYEAYLYASGRPNRIAISSVLASAPAGQAGIRPGDHILRYADQRIYDRRDLREAMRAGEVGDPVQVEVDRAGETLQFYLARGPMGVRTDALSLAP